MIRREQKVKYMGRLMANPIYNLARMEMNRLNFDTTRKKIKELRKEYQILDDITLRLLKENEMTNKSSDGEIMVYLEMFRLAFRLPI